MSTRVKTTHFRGEIDRGLTADLDWTDDPGDALLWIRCEGRWSETLWRNDRPEGPCYSGHDRECGEVEMGEVDVYMRMTPTEAAEMVQYGPFDAPEGFAEAPEWLVDAALARLDLEEEVAAVGVEDGR